MKVKLKKAKWDDLKVGDTVIFKDGDVGIVANKGKTLIHKHEYIEIEYLAETLYSVNLFKQKYLRCDYPNLPFFRIIIK